MSQSAQEHQGERVHVGAFVDREQREQLVELAIRDDRSVSSVIRQALASYTRREQLTRDVAGMRRQAERFKPIKIPEEA